jgi:hypothetical protein
MTVATDFFFKKLISLTTHLNSSPFPKPFGVFKILLHGTQNSVKIYAENFRRKEIKMNDNYSQKSIFYRMGVFSMTIDEIMTDIKNRHQAGLFAVDRWFLVNHGYRCSYAEKGILKNAATYLKPAQSDFLKVMNYADRNFELLVDYLNDDLASFSKLNREHITPFFFYPHPVLTQLESVFNNHIQYSLQEYILDSIYARVVYRPTTEKNYIELSTRQIRLAPLKVQTFLAKQMRTYGYIHREFVDELVWPEMALNAS